MNNIEKLNKIIDEKGIKKRKIAEELKITPTALNLKLKGKTEFKLSEIQNICEILGLRDGKIRNEIFFW